MPLEERQQQQDDHHAEPERRHGQSRDGDEPDHMVDPAVLVERRQRAQRNRDQHRQDRRHDGDLHGQLQPGGDFLRHRIAGPHGHAEVAGGHSADPFAELDDDRAVQSQANAFGFDDLLGNVGAFAAQHDLHRIAGHHAQHQEYQDRDPDQGRDHQEQSLGDVAEHTQGYCGKDPPARIRT
jgi:hypothetical protein